MISVDFCNVPVTFAMAGAGCQTVLKLAQTEPRTQLLLQLVSYRPQPRLTDGQSVLLLITPHDLPCQYPRRLDVTLRRELLHRLPRLARRGINLQL